jgi:hypothetical protein
MSQFLNTEDLITSIKTRTLMPVSQSTFTTANILQLINEEFQIGLVPEMMSVREDFFLRKTTTSIIASVEKYPVPERAIANTLKDVFFINQSNNRRPLTRINTRNQYYTQSATTEPLFYMMEGDYIVLTPPTSSSPSGSLEIYFYSRPNEMVSTSSCAKITSISSGAGTSTFTVDTDLTASLSVGQYVDFLSGKSPFLLWSQDVPITAITSTTIAVATSNVVDDNSTVQPVVNDFICPAKKACIPMVPQELHVLLAQLVAQRVVEALGDNGKMQAVTMKLEQMKKALMTLICNRVENSVEHLNNRNNLTANSGLGWPTGFTR